MRYLLASCGMVLLLSSAAFAQPTDPAVTTPSEPTTVNLTTGLSTGGSQTGPVIGGTMVAGVNSWLSVEATGAFTDRGSGATGVYGLGSAVFNILPTTRRVAPFASIGGGVYRASFDMGHQDMFGQYQLMAATLMQTIAGYGMPGFDVNRWTGPGNMMGVGSLPRPLQMALFYGRRMGDVTIPNTGDWGHRSFTDPAASVGTGVRIRLSDKVVLRPDVRALVVFADGDTETIGLVNLGIGFRF